MPTLPVPVIAALAAAGVFLAVAASQPEAPRGLAADSGDSAAAETGTSECPPYTRPVDGTLSDDGRSCLAADPAALCEATAPLQPCPDWAAVEAMAASDESRWSLRVCTGPEGLVHSARSDHDSTQHFGFDASGILIGYAHMVAAADADGWCCEGEQVFLVEAGVYEGDCTPLEDTAVETGSADTAGDSGTSKDPPPCGCRMNAGPGSTAAILLVALGIRRARKYPP